MALRLIDYVPALEVYKQGKKDCQPDGKTITVFNQLPGRTSLLYMPSGTILNPSGHGCYITKGSTRLGPDPNMPWP